MPAYIFQGRFSASLIARRHDSSPDAGFQWPFAIFPTFCADARGFDTIGLASMPRALDAQREPATFSFQAAGRARRLGEMAR